MAQVLGHTTPITRHAHTMETRVSRDIMAEAILRVVGFKPSGHLEVLKSRKSIISFVMKSVINLSMAWKVVSLSPPPPWAERISFLLQFCLPLCEVAFIRWKETKMHEIKKEWLRTLTRQITQTTFWYTEHLYFVRESQVVPLVWLHATVIALVGRRSGFFVLDCMRIALARAFFFLSGFLPSSCFHSLSIFVFFISGQKNSSFKGRGREMGPLKAKDIKKFSVSVSLYRIPILAWRIFWNVNFKGL